MHNNMYETRKSQNDLQFGAKVNFIQNKLVFL
jgi:hypothetical protein